MCMPRTCPCRPGGVFGACTRRYQHGARRMCATLYTYMPGTTRRYMVVPGHTLRHSGIPGATQAPQQALCLDWLKLAGTASVSSTY